MTKTKKWCFTCHDKTCQHMGTSQDTFCSDYRGSDRKPPFTPMYRVKKISWYKMSGEGEKQVWNGVVDNSKDVGFSITEADGMFVLHAHTLDHGFLTLKAAKVGAKTLMRQKVEKWCNLVAF